MTFIRLCCAFYQVQHNVGKCWAKTILSTTYSSSSNFKLLGHKLNIFGAARRDQIDQMNCFVDGPAGV
jgi:hypothetical protein